MSMAASNATRQDLGLTEISSGYQSSFFVSFRQNEYDFDDSDTEESKQIDLKVTFN